MVAAMILFVVLALAQGFLRACHPRQFLAVRSLYGIAMGGGTLGYTSTSFSAAARP